MIRSVLVMGLVMALGIFIGAAGMAAFHEESTPTVKQIAQYDMQEKIEGQETVATVVELNLAPGAEGSPHRHPGPVFGVILEGSYEWAIDDKPARVLKQGEVFYEPTGVLHRVSKNPSKQEKARVIAIVLHSQDVHDLVIPPDVKPE